jgi:hypothetical protein
MPNLTTAQKITVVELARKAYEAWPGRAGYELMLTAGKNGFTAWRHDQQENAIGVRSLRHCSDADYRSLLAHFHKLRVKHLTEQANLDLPIYSHENQSA